VSDQSLEEKLQRPAETQGRAKRYLPSLKAAYCYRELEPGIDKKTPFRVSIRHIGGEWTWRHIEGRGDNARYELEG
jgi:hypothetical protein